ncbi:unnamed protein product [Plutella xylostella]|nr:unnamed protein product [Plutella xylostella]
MLLENSDVDIFVASKIGSFKHIKYHSEASKNTKKCIENLVDIKKLQKDDTITRMVWANEEQTEILIGRRNQQVQTYNTEQAKFTQTVTADYAKGDVVGLGKYKRRLITALASGVVKIWSKKDEVVINTGAELDTLKSCEENRSVFATGGKENDIKLWLIGEHRPIFQAKNLANDWLQLRQPVWVTDLCFLPGEGGRLVVGCSRYGYVRLYDTRAQRRPVVNVEFKAMAATCVTPSFDDKQVLVGFGRGQLHQVDLRGKGRPDKGYKGSAGAITCVAAAPAPRRILSVGLDRHLRVHDYDSKALLYKQYLTSKLTGLLVQTATSTPLQHHDDEAVKEEEEVKEEDDLDALFEEMDTVLEKPKKKRAEEKPPTTEAKKLKPSTEGSTEVDLEQAEELEDSEDAEDPEEAIKKLLKSTEKKKKRMEKKKKEKRAKSVFFNA